MAKKEPVPEWSPVMLALGQAERESLVAALASAPSALEKVLDAYLSYHKEVVERNVENLGATDSDLRYNAGALWQLRALKDNVRGDLEALRLRKGGGS